jgi:glycosyltransferase involved in cell wall biosynthesis
MKIGVIHWAFPPVVGGVESHLIYLYGELARMGHEISFLTAPHPQRDDASVGWCKVTSHELMSIEHLLSVPAEAERWQNVYSMIEKYVIEESPDVIHAHNLHYFFPDHAESLGIISKKYGIPIVLTVHNYWEDDLCRHLLHDIGWNMVVSVSYHMKRSCFFDAKLPQDKLEVHFHGIDLDKYRPVEDQESLKLKLGMAGRRVIFHPARMCEMKGTLNSIEAVSRLRQKYPNICLVLSGNGDTVDFEKERPAFNTKVRQVLDDLKVSDCIQFVSIAADDMPTYMSAADIVIYPTILPQGEAFGIAPIEAMACCRPVIVTNSGGLVESTFHNINGLVIDRNVPTLSDDLARNIEYLLERPDVGRYLGSNGREVAEERFDSKKMALKMEDLYNRLAYLKLAESPGRLAAVADAGLARDSRGDTYSGQVTRKKTMHP